MKGSENNYKNCYEFDPQSDFLQFLEEARKHSSHDKESPITKSGKTQQKIINQESKKSKKLWKYVLFPFLKSSSNKKSKQHSKETFAPNTKPRAYVSGPIYGTGGGAAASSGRYQNRLMASGPLTGLFKAKKREENEMVSYVSLEKLNKPLDDATVYGPLYLVS
ncbi:hypothetical protein RND81_05G240200 [Saponaria officinalis]|uniref:Uncharacterized protein n=1 Tax=Saponaria officinalis TaxID=3572 RepID=A0AAW1L3H5_SAPOF